MGRDGPSFDLHALFTGGYRLRNGPIACVLFMALWGVLCFPLGRVIKLYDDDRDLLEDLLIEIKQGIDMSSNSLSIISSTTDAFNGIVSNNLNNVMKVLTSITLIISLPTLISGIYGMNVEGMPLPYFWFTMALCGVVIAVAFVILRKKRMI